MALVATLKQGETLGDRVMKVDHAGEHGAVCIYRAQRWFARWRAPEMVEELDDFLAHERRHRALFGAELARRNRVRCRSYLWCGLGGIILGAMTGLAGRQAIAATTVAIERVVLRHLEHQIAALGDLDDDATRTILTIIADEQEHHRRSATHVSASAFWPRLLDPLVSASTEAVIWMGMRL